MTKLEQPKTLPLYLLRKLWLCCFLLSMAVLTGLDAKEASFTSENRVIKVRASEIGSSIEIQGEDSLQIQSLFENLMIRFKALKPPRDQFYLLKTIRSKKYENTRKDLDRMRDFLTKNPDTTLHTFMPLYEKMIDKINWVDGYRRTAPQTFVSSFEADKYFKSTPSIVEDILKTKKQDPSS